MPAASTRQPRSDRDRGAATTELLIAVPALLLMTLGIVQVAVYEHAQHIAQAVAAQAVSAARLQDGSASAGQAAGQRLLDQLGPCLGGVTITVRRGTQRVSVTVVGHAESVLPGLAPPVRVTGDGPVERLPVGAAGPGEEVR